MTWIPNPQEPSANFEEPIISNTLTIIERDFKGGLDYYHPTENYPDFAERALGQILGNEFPSLAIGPLDNPTEDADDRSHIVEAARVQIYMGVTGDSPSTVTITIMRYVAVMDAVLRSARKDFFTGMSNPFGVWLKLDHTYGPIGNKESIYFRSAILELTVNLRER